MRTNQWKIMSLLLLFSYTTFAQLDFTLADSIASSITDEEIALEDLAARLSDPLPTDTEKARAIYMWVAGNIRYDCRKYHNMDSKVRFTAYSEEELLEKRAAYLEKNLQRTLKWRKGVCEDYSRLFMALGEEAGLEVVLISGHARDFNKPHRKALGGSHAWNAVKLDGQWYLLDATWGAGYTNAEVSRFKRRLSPGYFMVSPDIFIQTHFPDDPAWQLLPKAVTQKGFAAQPMINIAELKYDIVDFSPQVVTRNGKKIVRLQFKNTPKYFKVASLKSKPIPFKKREKDGYVELEIGNSRASKIKIFAGNSRRLDWIATYNTKKVD